VLFRSLLRLSLAKELGADLVIRSDDPDLMQHLLNFTKGKWFDCVLVCAATTSSSPINLGSKILRSKGRLVVVGRVGMDLERKEFYQKELELIMSRSLGPGRYDPSYEEKGIDYPLEYVRWTLNRNMESFMGLLETKKVNVTSMIGGEYPIERAPEAYSFLKSQSRVALVLTYPSSKESETSPLHPGSSHSTKFEHLKAPISTALVGPGNFAKETLIPLLRKNSKDFRLKWVVSSNPVRSKQIASRYRFERPSSDYSDVLNDIETPFIVISAPNNLHYPMLMSAMKAGKVVFVEKPLCITIDELDQIRKAQSATDVPVFVGFNRRYAPQILKVKEVMEELDGPFMITYRANVGFIPTSRWVQDPSVGGGRIIAECCHFFDLFNFLLRGRKPESILASSAGVNGSSSVAMDNVAVTLKYDDGSVANLIYVALGSKEMDRERLEIFGQGVSMVLDDFKTLSVYGPRPLSLKLPKQDKGWKAEFEEIAKFMKGEKSSAITFQECIDATELTFHVEEAVRKSSSGASY